MQFLPKLENQTENEFISELMADCLDLHVFAKAATIQTLDEKNQTGIMSFYLEYGDEPQYKLLRLLGFYSEINPEAQKDMLPKINELADKARSYINKLKKQSPETRRIRGSAEYLYLEGASPEEIVTEMIDAGVEGVEFVAVNTDAQDLKASKAKQKVQLGLNLTKENFEILK